MSTPVVAFDPQVLIQYGILGFVLLWFMVRLEKKLDKLDVTLNRLCDCFVKEGKLDPEIKVTQS